ncbi:hypothetical protein [Lichenicoccus sp.]|uniref:hypothetical protein n=1 Tax=Lichenicoccus sp. TaxID=2781899 RepID=UPI003D0EEB92
MARAAKAGATRRATRPQGQQGWKWWHGMAAGMLLMLSPATALLLAALAAPVVFAIVADTTHRHTLSRTIGLFVLAGAIGPLQAYATCSYDMTAAVKILSRPTTIPLTWMMGGCGWLVDEVCCLGAAFIATMRLAARKKALEAALSEICKEWEISPNQDKPPR